MWLNSHSVPSAVFDRPISYPENITPDSEGVEPKTMTIGINNVFEVGCGILLCCHGSDHVQNPKPFWLHDTYIHKIVTYHRYVKFTLINHP